MMTKDECHAHASLCAGRAALAESEAIALEFLNLAAIWRAMASRGIPLSEMNDVTRSEGRAAGAH